MTQVIKRLSPELPLRVRPLPALASRLAATVRPPDPTKTELEALRQRIEELSGELRQRDALIETLPSEISKAADEGEARGRQIGLAEAAVDHGARLKQIEKNVSDALETLAQESVELRRLAPLVALTALEQVLGVGGRQPALVRRIIDRQLSALEAQSVLRVEVSSLDFPSGKDVAALVRPGVEIKASDELGPGDCRIKLALGSLEVGVGQQWDVLSQTLREMATA